MRYALLMHYREPGEGEIREEAIAQAQEAFGAYGRALESAGVLLSADVLQPSAAMTSVTCREGGLRVQDGPFAETKEALAGIFVLEVPDLDAAIAHLLDRLGREEEAVAAYDSAISLTHDTAERRYLENRRDRVGRQSQTRPESRKRDV